MPRIPNALRQAIKQRLLTDSRPMSSQEVADGVNSTVSASHRRSPRQMAFVLKQMVREGDLIIASSIKNGLTAHGNERSRVTFALNHEVEDPDIVSEDE